MRMLVPFQRHRILPLFVALAVMVLAAGDLMVRPGHAAPEGSRFNASYFGNLNVVTHDGRTVKFYDDLIKGKRVVINFAYLNCNDICPLAVSRLAEVKRVLGDAVGRDVFFYTITMDPERDTPELLKMYADGFDAGAGWLFLTGKREDIDHIRFQLGERSRKLTEHRNDLVLGNDIEGEWSRSSAFSEIEVLAETIRELDPAYREKVRVLKAASGKGVQMSPEPGQALFRKACATCHTIGRGTLVGPDLKHVASRRNHAWLTEFLKAPERVRAGGDPAITELMAKFRGVRMPNLGLQDADVADLLVYIETQSKKQDAAASASEGGKQPQPVAAPKG